ncbi:MAG: ABC transporter permease, partial [Actinomycetota bacterium]|nr:ABC transporter permease [Actinomycetota bacterium]
MTAGPGSPPAPGAARHPLGRELWSARWLLVQWVRRDFIVRYRQSVLGVAWSLVQPMLLLAVYGIVFVKFLHVRAPHGSYLVFAYAGLAPWTFATNAINSGVTSLSNTASIIKQVYFPRSLVALAAGGVVVVDLAVGVVVLLVLQLVTAGTVHLATIALLPILAGLILIVEAVTVVMAVIGAFIRDIRFVVPVLLQVGFIATPIMYPARQINGHWSWLLSLNPFALVIAGIRSAVIDG